MKRLTYLFVFSILFGTVWMACDKIEEPFSLINESDFPENPDDTLFFVDSISVLHTQVLLEDFTGHLCVNCPEAAKLAHDLAEDLDHKLIIYAVHAGNFAEPVPETIFDTDFRTDVGESLNTDYSIFANPLAMINRVENNGLIQIFMDSWETVVMDELQKPNVVNMKLCNTWYPNFKLVIVEIETEFLAQPEGQYKLVVYIAEDLIEAPQLNNDPAIGGDTLFNYIHRNVLRDAVNSTYGDFLGDNNGEVTTGEVYTNIYRYNVNSEWVTKNCRIIAYVGKFDENLNLIDIVQVAELEIKVDE